METGPILYLSLLCAMGSDVEWTFPRGRGSEPSLTPPATLCRQAGAEASLPQLALSIQWLLPVAGLSDLLPWI